MENRSWITTLGIEPPSLSNNAGDADRLLAALKTILETDAIELPLSLTRRLPSLLREWQYRVCCVLFRERNTWRVVTLLPPDASPPLGLAIDLGTSRVVLRLLDLAGGETLGEIAFDNPQIAIGPDVLARVHHCDQAADGGERLKQMVVDAISRHAADLAAAHARTPEEIVLLAIAGNTTMTHLLLGLDPHWIIREPYIPAVNRPGLLAAAELGIAVHPEAVIKVFPNIGSYFGGDLIAGILCSGIDRAEETALLVDVGTNAEVVVGNKDWLIACAGAAGPALEGGVSDMGMTAGPGVIDSVRIDPENLEIEISTIDNKPAIGICGSGMIDLAAQLFLSGMIDIRGKFVKERCGDKLFDQNEINCFRLVDALNSGTGSDIVLTQIDLNSLTSSKAAMHSILEVIIVQTAGLEFTDLATFYVAGTFGSFINPKSAISIGMLPDIPIDRFEVLGNSSLGGAVKLLTEPASFAEIEEIRRGITYIELNVNQEFMNIFSGAKFYPHTDRSRFPSVTFYGDKEQALS